jgi:hypothetical protein
VLIGSRGWFETGLSPEDCAQRLKQSRMRAVMLGSRADSSGFSLRRGWRTIIRIRGTFAPAESGPTHVDYRVELIPAAMFALVVSTVIGIVVLAFLLTLAHEPLVVLWPFIPIAVLVIAANIWISER